MADLDKLKFYTANGAKFTINVLTPTRRLTNIFLIAAVMAFYGWGSFKFVSDGSEYLLGPVAIVLGIHSLIVSFAKIEFELSTKLITEIKYFGLWKKIRPFSQFTEFTYVPRKYLWFITAGYTAILNFTDAQGKNSMMYFTVVGKMSEVEELYRETNLLLES